MSEGVDLTVPRPAGIAALPVEGRGIVVPVHVPRFGGQAPRISDIDPHRLLIIAAAQRCTLCGWAFGPDERIWYVTEQDSIDKIAASDWRLWDTSLEGGAHLDCLVYASVVCPYLTTPEYQRRTAQRAIDGSIVYEKGHPRPQVVLAGVPEMVVRLANNGQRPFEILMGGGPPETLTYVDGREMLPLLLTLIDESPRAPTDEDLAFSARMAESNSDEMVRHATWITVDVAGKQGLPPPKGVERNDPCFCGSRVKFKRCCLRRYDAARAARTAGLSATLGAASHDGSDGSP